MLNVINLYGAGGVGKSTMSAQIFASLKILGTSVELVHEYQKDLVYEDASSVYWDNQVYLFAQQYHKLNRLVGKVNFAVTDNPLLTALAYRQYTDTPASLDNLVLDCFKLFNNHNYVIKRNPSYFKEEGRKHNLEQSIIIDRQIEQALVDNALEFTVVEIADDVLYDLTFVKGLC